jgi:hypothetical protein
MPTVKQYGAYFARPFPRAEGFSAYRFPGVFVHIPLFFMFLYLGLYLNWETPWLRPCVILYLLLGLYVGRDIAVYAHYMPLLIFVVAALVIFAPSLATLVLKPLRTALGSFFPVFSLCVDLGVLAAFVYYVRHWIMISEEAPEV